MNRRGATLPESECCAQKGVSVVICGGHHASPPFAIGALAAMPDNPAASAGNRRDRRAGGL